MDEDLLPLLQARFLDQSLPRRQADQGYGSRFLHGECFGLKRHGIFIHGNEFRERADSILRWPGIDLISDLESPYSTSNSNDDPSHIVAQNERQAIGQNHFELSV